MKLKFTLVLGAGLFSIYSSNTLLSSLFPQVQEEFLLTPFLLGIITSSYGWAYASLQVPAGLAADRYSPKLLVFASLFSFFLSSLLFAISSNSFVLVASRIAMGAAASFVYVDALKSIEFFYAPKDRGKSIGIVTALAFAGISFSNLLASILLQTQLSNWRTIYALASFLALIASLLSLAYLPRGLGTSTDGISVKVGTIHPRNADSSPRIYREIIDVSRSLPFWIQSAIAFIYFGTLVGFIFWLPTYFGQTKLGLVYGGISVVALGIGSVVGLVLGGWIVDRIGRAKSVLIAFVAVDCAASFLIISLHPGAENSTLLMIVCFVLGASFGGGTGGVRLVAILYPRELLGTAYGLYNSVAWLGSAVYPLIVGFALSIGLTFQMSFIVLALSNAACLVLSFFSYEPSNR